MALGHRSANVAPILTLRHRSDRGGFLSVFDYDYYPKTSVFTGSQNNNVKVR